MSPSTSSTPQPLISVLMPYYNNLEHVEASIQSAYAQSYPHWELIVVNDASPDPEATAHIEALQQRFGFTLIHSPRNQGASKTLQTAFEASRGEYISVLSHDDLYTPNKLELSMQWIQEHGLDAIYCNGAIINNANDVPPQPFETATVEHVLATEGQAGVAALISENDNYGCLLTQGAVYSRRVFEELAWVRDQFLLDDYPFTVLVWQRYKTSFCSQVVYLYRHHDHNIHKEFWRWLPARVQVVCQLVPPERRIEALSFLLSNLGEFHLQQQQPKEALRLCLAGLALSQEAPNTAYAKRLLAFTGLPQKALWALLLALLGLLGPLVYKRLLKALTGVLPSKALRSRCRQWLKV